MERFHRGTKVAKADDNFTCEVLEELGTLSSSDKGYEMKLRYISWNGAEPKYDIRLWKVDENGEEKCVPKSGRTFTGDEIYELAKILKGMLDEEEKPQEKKTTKAKSAACNARTTNRATKTSATTKKPTAKAKATTKKGNTRK